MEVIMENESDIKMDTKYFLNKIQNIKSENITLQGILEKIQTEYQNWEKIQKWKEKKLEYVFVTPLSRLKARRKLLSSSISNLEEPKKLGQMIPYKSENVSVYEKIAENRLIIEDCNIENGLRKKDVITDGNLSKEEKAGNNAGEKNPINHLSEDSHLKSINDSENCVSNGLTFRHTGKENFHSTPKEKMSSINSGNENSQNMPSKENHLSSKDLPLRSISDDRNFNSNDLNVVCPEEKNIQNAPLLNIDNDTFNSDKEDGNSTNIPSKENVSSIKTNEQDKNAQNIPSGKYVSSIKFKQEDKNAPKIPSAENLSSIKFNRETSDINYSKRPYKRRMKAVPETPARKSPRFNNVNFLHEIPAKKSTSTVPSNKTTPDPSLGEGISLKPKTNYGLKKALFKMPTSDSKEDTMGQQIQSEEKIQSGSKEDTMLPDLEDSIFEEMNENNNLPDRSLTNQKLKPFNNCPRKIRRSVPKPVESSLKDLEKCDFSDQNIYSVAYRLANTLIRETGNLECGDSSSEMKLIIFFILKYLTVSYLKPIFNFKETQDASVLLPRTEMCIVFALRKMESIYYKGILSSMVFTIHQLVLAMPSLPIFGCCAICRILTKICKMKHNPRIPIDLCCDILKMKHKFSTMLIASVVGVWPELLLVPLDAPEEEATLYRTVGFFSTMWPEAGHSTVYKIALSQKEWLTSKELLDKFNPPSTFNPEETVDFLMNRIEEHCLNESYSKENMLTASLVVIANCKGLYWAKKNVINKFLVHNLCKFIDSDRNERALSLFCKLYAEICSRYPEMSNSEELLFKIFHAGMENEDDKYMQDPAAEAIIQIMLSRNQPLDDSIKKWYEQNSDNPKFSSLKLLFFRADLRDVIVFTDEHIFLKTDLFL